MAKLAIASLNGVPRGHQPTLAPSTPILLAPPWHHSSVVLYCVAPFEVPSLFDERSKYVNFWNTLLVESHPCGSPPAPTTAT